MKFYDAQAWGFSCAIRFVCLLRIIVSAGVVIVVVDRFYIVLFSALEQTHHARMRCARVISFLWCVVLFLSFLSTEVMYLQRCLIVTWLVPRETAAISARSVYTIQSCTTSLHTEPHT